MCYDEPRWFGAHSRPLLIDPIRMKVLNVETTDVRVLRSLLGWRPSLVGWRPSLLGWRPSRLGEVQRDSQTCEMQVPHSTAGFPHSGVQRTVDVLNCDIRSTRRGPQPGIKPGRKDGKTKDCLGKCTLAQ